MGYLTASHGFKSGGFNGDWGRATPAQREFDDEEVDHYEVGLKTASRIDRVQINAAAFYSDFTNYQEAGFVALQFLVTNAEKVTVQGRKSTCSRSSTRRSRPRSTRPSRRRSSTRSRGGSCYPGRPIDQLGDRQLRSERRTADERAGAEDARRAAVRGKFSFGSLYARTDWTWSDEYHTNSNHDPRQLQDAFSVVDARIGVRFGSWDVSLWSENLLDETYVYQSGGLESVRERSGLPDVPRAGPLVRRRLQGSAVSSRSLVRQRTDSYIHVRRSGRTQRNPFWMLTTTANFAGLGLAEPGDEALLRLAVHFEEARP